jgi:hypothetical protein
MKTFVVLLLSTFVLSTEAATAARRPKALSKRAFAHTTEAKGHYAHMHFRHSPHPLPMMDLKAHDPEKFKTVPGAKSYKFK